MAISLEVFTCGWIYVLFTPTQISCTHRYHPAHVFIPPSPDFFISLYIHVSPIHSPLIVDYPLSFFSCCNIDFCPYMFMFPCICKWMNMGLDCVWEGRIKVILFCFVFKNKIPELVAFPGLDDGKGLLLCCLKKNTISDWQNKERNWTVGRSEAWIWKTSRAQSRKRMKVELDFP